MSKESFLSKTGFGKITAVGDLGFGSWIARTRRRLLVSAAVATALFLGWAWFTAGFMRDTSSSATVNLWLITATVLLLLVVSFVGAMAVGDLIFKGRWRERVLLGKKIEHGDGEDVESTMGGLQDRTMPFYLTVAAMIAVNYVGYSAATQNFFGYYSDYGYEVTLLRSADADDRIRGLQAFSHPLHAEVQDEPLVRVRIVELLADPDEEVQGWAFWLVGELQIVEATQDLLAIVSDEANSEIRRARAAEVLGLLRSRQGADVMAGLLRESFGRSELAIGLLRGLGLGRYEASAPAIADFLHVEPYDIRAHAFWALGYTGNQSYRSNLTEFLESEDQVEQCLAAEALKFLASEDDLLDAHVRFADAEMFACPPLIWTGPYHWDENRSFQFPIVVDESLKAKFLKVIRTAGGPEERDFFATVANDELQPDEIRALARELALLIDRGR